MALVDILMPRMGESVFEGTIVKWFKKPGDHVADEETLLEVATDKVDTELPSPFEGELVELLYNEGDVVQIGTPIARIKTNKEEVVIATPKPTTPQETQQPTVATQAAPVETKIPQPVKYNEVPKDRFYSPLVLNIARAENIDLKTLETIPGTGNNGRVTKNDILNHLASKNNNGHTALQEVVIPQEKVEEKNETTQETFTEKKAKNHILATRSISGQDEIIEMDRMRKMIAERMLDSKRISAHVTSFVEADVTNVVQWRNKWKKHFNEKEDTILTFTPIFIHAIIKAIKDYPMINASVIGDKIHIKKDINIGLAVALSNGNLVVPVIKAADQLNIIGLTKQVNHLAKKARNNQLTADDLSGGTYTVSNMGSFGNVMGTPIIVQPQIAIMALGAVKKKPAVIETPEGDTIGIRHMMMLSHTYDHRVVDGSLGGMFVRRVADNLEKFSPDMDIF